MSLDEILQTAIEQNKTYLPQFLKESIVRCQVSSQNANDQESCLREVQEQTFSMLTCESNLVRWQEMGDLDHEDMGGILKEHPATAVPRDVQKIFDELTATAEALWKDTPAVKNFPLPQWKLQAYSADFYNAQAGATGAVMISSKFWQSSTAFHLDDVRAILAHEVAHVLLNHSLELGCIYYEWSSQPAMAPLREARDIIRGDFSVTMGAGKAWSELSQKNEFRADAMAVELITMLHHDGMAMSRAIQKIYDLSPKGGFTSGSHPEMEDRIEQAALKAKHLNIPAY